MKFENCFLREAAEERERLQKELDDMMEEERIKRVKEIDERDAVRLQRLKMQETMIRQQIAERQVNKKRINRLVNRPLLPLNSSNSFYYCSYYYYTKTETKSRHT